MNGTIRHCKLSKLCEQFISFISRLGSGTQGKVYLGKDITKKIGEQQVAIKIVKSETLQDHFIYEMLQNEIQIQEILSKSSNVNILKLSDVIKTNFNTYLISQFCNQGDLRKMLTKLGKIQERVAIKIIKQLVHGLKELYKNKIIHRDLKPENILLHDNIIKIGDFGLAKQVKDLKSPNVNSVGTPLYMSPQALQNQTYTAKCDIWSIGLIFYEMLVGSTPWPSQTQYELLQNIYKNQVKFPYNIEISDETKSFIKKCLYANEQSRFSFDELYHHPLVQTPLKNNLYQQINTKVSKSLSFDYDCIRIITKFQNILQQSNLDMEILFEKFCSNENKQKKFLNKQQFRNIFLQVINDLDPTQIDKVFQQYDRDHNNKMDWDEFQKLFLETDYEERPKENEMLINYQAERIFRKLKDLIILNNLNLERIFKQYDSSGNNMLDIKEFTKILQVIDEFIHENEVKYVFKMFDKNNDGEISLQEFEHTLYSIKQQSFKEIDNGNQLEKQPSTLLSQLNEQQKLIVVELQHIIKLNKLNIEMIFTKFDKDQSNDLNLFEFSKIIKIINDRISSDDLNSLFNILDTNQNGKLDLNEFKRIMFE